MKIYVISKLDIDEYDGEYTCSECCAAFTTIEKAKEYQEMIVSNIEHDITSRENEDSYCKAIDEKENIIKVQEYLFTHVISISEIELND